MALLWVLFNGTGRGLCSSVVAGLWAILVHGCAFGFFSLSMREPTETTDELSLLGDLDAFNIAGRGLWSSVVAGLWASLVRGVTSVLSLSTQGSLDA